MSSDWKQVLAGLDIAANEEVAEVVASAVKEPRKAKPVLTLFFEKRRGKPSTIIAGLEDDEQTARELASRLKQRLACGGSERDGEILLQGDVRNRVRELLLAEGYKVKG